MISLDAIIIAFEIFGKICFSFLCTCAAAFFMIAIDFIKFEHRKIFTPLFLGFFSAIAIFWSLDRGVYYFIGITILLCLALVKKRYLSSKYNCK